MRATKNTCFCPIFSLDNCEISWIDEDGDSINVQSSEDLVHALSGMKDTAFIKFDLLESKTAQNPTYDVATNQQSVSSEYLEIHVGTFYWGKGCLVS